MADSILNEVLSREAEISARLSREKNKFREQIDAMQAELERSYDESLKKLHARFKSSLHNETERVEQMCRIKSERLDIHSNSLPHRTDEQIHAITKRHLLEWLEGESDDHKDVKD